MPSATGLLEIANFVRLPRLRHQLLQPAQLGRGSQFAHRAQLQRDDQQRRLHSVHDGQLRGLRLIGSAASGALSGSS